jgi:uncharacterized membrane protein
MLRKLLIIPALLLAATFMPTPAKAAVRFGVGIGGPVYAPAYPYTYSVPYYGYYAYPTYPGPYVYGTWGWGWGRGWHGRYYRRWR